MAELQTEKRNEQLKEDRAACVKARTKAIIDALDRELPPGYRIVSEDDYMFHFDYLSGMTEGAKRVRAKNEIDKIIVNGDATIVFWHGGDKTIVKRAAGEPGSLYAAVTAALAKRVYGNNTRFKKMIEKKVVVQGKKR